MATLIIAGTSRGAGKTALAAGLAAHLAKSGRAVAVGVAWSAAGSSTADGEALRSLLPNAATIEPVPVASSAPSRPEVSEAGRHIAGASGNVAVAVVEGWTGDAAANAALAEEVDGLIVLAARYGDDILSAARGFGSRLAGVVINAVPRFRVHYLENELVPSLERAGVKVFGWLPDDRRLLAPTVRLVAEHLGGEFTLWEENGGRLIDNFLIGGMVLDWGPFYFGSQENVGVIVRGDRPDIQLAAVQTGTVRALVLTKGVHPIEYVHYEADQRETPVVVVPTDTPQTAAKLESLLPKIRFDHPDKLARLFELADGRLDLDAIAAAAAEPATR